MSTTPNPVTGPIVCQPWCEDHDGHTGEIFAVDQVCMSKLTYVHLSMGDVEMDSGGVWGSGITVYVRDDHGSMSVAVGADEGGTWHMSAVEADAFAQVLTDHARILRETESGK